MVALTVLLFLLWLVLIFVSYQPRHRFGARRFSDAALFRLIGYLHAVLKCVWRFEGPECSCRDTDARLAMRYGLAVRVAGGCRLQVVPWARGPVDLWTRGPRAGRCACGTSPDFRGRACQNFCGIAYPQKGASTSIPVSGQPMVEGAV